MEYRNDIRHKYGNILNYIYPDDFKDLDIKESDNNHMKSDSNGEMTQERNVYNTVVVDGKKEPINIMIHEPKFDGHQSLNISKPPYINVMSADVFKDRVADVFHLVADTLAKSYGPYGSSTIISQYPYNHTTKDGYSIAKMISFSKENSTIDDSIKNLILAPCTRLNFSVGDGTTTVIEAVNAIYQEFINNKEKWNEWNIPPRDILKEYNAVRDMVIDRLDDETESISDMPHDDMVRAITNLAYISSNGDEEITTLIHDLYDELDYPLIDITKAIDGVTKKSIIKGYQFNAILRDNLYVNNDNFTAEHTNVDVILLDHKVTLDTYKKLLVPLNNRCRNLSRHLVVIAPMYDDVAMLTIKRDLTGEYQAVHDINMILMTASITRGEDRNLYEDLALLLSTEIISMGMEKDIISAQDDSSRGEMLDIERRRIPGINVLVKSGDDSSYGWTKDNGNINDDMYYTKYDAKAIRVGFAGKVVLGMKDGSTFDNLIYDKVMYDSQIKTIEHALAEARKKSESLTTYNFDARALQNRLYKLRMKIGIIEVGGESPLSQEMLQDSVDDTVKAASSAYLNGVVKGCSISTIRAINACIEEERNKENSSDIRLDIMNMMLNGFSSVYGIILESRYDNFDIMVYQYEMNSGAHMRGVSASRTYVDIYEQIKSHWKNSFNIPEEMVRDFLSKKYYPSINSVLDNTEYESSIASIKTDAFTFIIDLSKYFKAPFDITTGTINPDIINSVKTDKEILKASSDLISLLMTGNQFIVAG